jgi:hypothetical protein
VNAPSGQPAGVMRRKVSPALWVAAVVMLVVPIAGLAVHAALYFSSDLTWVAAYRKYGMILVGVLASSNLVANYFHHRRTRMDMDIVSRFLTWLWVLSIFLLLWKVMTLIEVE